MMAQLNRNALLLMAFGLTVMMSQTGFAQDSSAAGASDKSTCTDSNQYCVTFEPWAGRQIVFRDEDGNFVGNSTVNAPLEVQISREMMVASYKSGKIDVPTLLSQLNPAYDAAGNEYLIMEFPFETTTAEGRVLPAGKKIMLDIRDFYQTKILQPVGARAGVADPRDATGAQVQTVDTFTDTLNTGGVTSVTQPTPMTSAEADRLVETGDEDLVDDRAYIATGKNYFDVRGTAFGYTKFLSAPVCSCARGACRISSGYGYRKSRRTMNGRHMSSFHRGIDLAGGAGTPVVAAADGCVSRLTKGGGYGTSIYLSHGNGFETQYSHLRSMSASVKYGQCFKRGDRIGSMGQTGNATGPHLHFDVVYNGVRKDPRPYMISTTGTSLSKRCEAQPDFPAIDSAMEKALGKNAPGALIRRRSSGAQ